MELKLQSSCGRLCADFYHFFLFLNLRQEDVWLSLVIFLQQKQIHGNVFTVFEKWHSVFICRHLLSKWWHVFTHYPGNVPKQVWYVTLGDMVHTACPFLYSPQLSAGPQVFRLGRSALPSLYPGEHPWAGVWGVSEQVCKVQGVWRHSKAGIFRHRQPPWLSPAGSVTQWVGCRRWRCCWPWKHTLRTTALETPSLTERALEIFLLRNGCGVVMIDINYVANSSPLPLCFRTQKSHLWLDLSLCDTTYAVCVLTCSPVSFPPFWFRQVYYNFITYTPGCWVCFVEFSN